MMKYPGYAVSVEPNNMAGAGDAVVEVRKLAQAAQERVMGLCSVFVPVGPTIAINSLIHKMVRDITRAVDREIRSVCPSHAANQNASTDAPFAYAFTRRDSQPNPKR
jgi:hypothetical protein